MNLTVGKLIDALSKYPDNAEICINDCTYGLYFADYIEYEPDLNEDDIGNKGAGNGIVAIY